MSVQRLIQQLGKEARRSPKKAAVLGLLTLVALWFWAPLIWSWVAPDQSGEETAVVQAGVTSAPSLAPAHTSLPAASSQPAVSASSAETAPARARGKGASPSRPDWRQLVEWMGIATCTQPAELPEGLRDPFALSVEPEPAVAVETESGPEPEEAQPAVDPASLGLVLSSTIVGPRLRAARIAGKTYHRGETLVVTKDGRQYQFVLAEIHPRVVVLEGEAGRFELRLPKPDLSNAIRPYRPGAGSY